MQGFIEDNDTLRPKSPEETIRELVKLGESLSLEFKSTARWNVKEGKKDKAIEQVIVKTVAAFLNSKGGDLLIGIQDDGSVFGIEEDQRIWESDQRNRDHYENWLTGLLLGACGKQHAPNLHISFARLDDKDVCRVTVLPSATAVYVKAENLETLYVRAGNSTHALPVKEAVAYHQQRFTNFRTLPVEPEKSQTSKKYTDFRQILEESKRHPKQDYFILKAIIVNNLFGVDIMEEAVEICKLRLFLKLVAQVESKDRIEPLPDIDFNIRAGNTLVGYALKTDFQPSRGIRTDEENRIIAQVEDEALTLDAKVRTFRLQQTRLDGTVDAEDKNSLRKQFTALESKFNEYLSNEYAAKRSDRSSWTEVHKPFHWLCDFHSIMQSGGFDVIIGNPPYVEIPKSYSRSYLGRLYKSALPVWSRDEDLYTLVVERSLRVLKNDGRFGMILPLSLCFSTKKSFVALRRLVGEEPGAWWWSHFDRIPSALFGSEVRTRCTIALLARSQSVQHRLRATTSLLRWTEDQRPKLFKDLRYSALSTDILEGIPKVSSQEQADVLQQMLKAGKPLPLDGPKNISYSFLASAAPDFPQPCVYVGGTAYNWFPAWRDIPPTTGEDGRPSLPARTAGMQYVTEEEANVVFALLCSSLGYWWWAIASDGFNLKRWLIDRFPLSIGSIDPKGRKEVGLLGKQLRSALRKQYVYKDNKGRIGNYYLPACDELIRNIDQALVSYVPVLSAEFMADIQVFNQSFSRNEDSSSGEDEDEG